MMEVVVTTGAITIRCANCQQTNTQRFHRPDVLPVACQALKEESITITLRGCAQSKLTWVYPEAD